METNLFSWWDCWNVLLIAGWITVLAYAFYRWCNWEEDDDDPKRRMYDNPNYKSF